MRTVVEEGSLHRAAARLHISPSALSRQMQSLEHELGGRLLECMTTGVSPTAGLSPGQQIAALRAGEIDIGITMDSTELIAGEFYTRKLAEVGSCIALSEQHRLATRDRVRLSDLKGEFFLGWDSQQVPGWDRRVEEYCKKYGNFRPKFHGPAKSLAQAFELAANENAVLLLAASASHLSPPGVVILPLADAEVTWKILVIWRRGRAGGALKVLLDALFTRVSPQATEAKGQGAQVPRESTDRRVDPLFAFTGQ
jgi:DNA-binding transcriptional LysR family regulator